MIAGLAATLPKTLTAGLTAQGVPLAQATAIAHLPPVSTVFAARLGQSLGVAIVGSVLAVALMALAGAAVSWLRGKKPGLTEPAGSVPADSSALSGSSVSGVD